MIKKIERFKSPINKIFFLNYEKITEIKLLFNQIISLFIIRGVT